MGPAGENSGGSILKTASCDVNRDHEDGKRKREVPMKLTIIASVWLTMVPALTAAASVELAAFADKPFCEKVAAWFGQHQDFNTELSKTVQWEPVVLNGLGPATRRCSSFDRTRMDLDNDGQEDLVVKATFCPKGAPSDSLYVFPTDSTVLEQASWQDTSPLLATHDKFERTGGTYPLTRLRIEKDGASPTLRTSFSVQPFLLDGQSYVGLTDTRRKWMVIAKYRGGEQFEDLCYLREQ